VHLARHALLVTTAVFSLVAVAAERSPLAFTEALAIGEQYSARLAAQQAAIDAASEQVPRATEPPDPKLRFGIDNLPVTGSDAFSANRDFMTMRRIGYVQDMPNGEKRQARGERADRERRVEVATMAARRVQVREETAMSWLELYYAERTATALEELVKAFKLEAESVAPAVTGGRLSLANALAARVAVETAEDRLVDQQRLITRARAALTAMIGEAAARPLGSPPNTNVLLHSPESLVSAIEVHPAQRVFEEKEALAESEVALAASTRKPDWNWEVSFGQREPNFSNMVTVMVGIDLPFWKSQRQDRDVAARSRQLDQARANREDARRMHEAEVRSLMADWNFAAERMLRFEKRILPLARERSELALAAYRGGRGDLGAVLESRRAETDVTLSHFAAELERARAWARLNFLLEHGEQK
jgi:outer membrane protein TolC